MIGYLFLGVAYGFLAGVQPGPLQAYFIGQTLRAGWRRTIILAVVPLLSDLPIVALVVFILSQMTPALELAIRFLGGFFLLFFAVNVVRSIRSLHEDTVAAETGGAATSLWKVVRFNFLNPYPYLYWGLVSGPVLLAAWRESPGYGVAMLAGFYFTIILVNAAVILIVSLARRLPLVVRQGLLAVSALGLAFFGLSQLWAGIQRLAGIV